MSTPYLLCAFRRSSKSRRKAESKKHRLREGSRFEEESLVDVLGEIVASSDSAREDVHKLLSSLLQFGFLKEARDLQAQYGELLDSIKNKMDTIWPPVNNQQVTETTSTLVSQSIVKTLHKVEVSLLFL